MSTVIIGNSAAGLNAIESFRKTDRHSKLILISKDPGPAYSRVLLPYYLRDRIPYENLFIRRTDWYREMGVETCFDHEVIELDTKQHRLTLSGASEGGGSGKAVHGRRHLSFDRLLIATGSHPVKPPIENLDGPGVFHLWTLEDARSLYPLFAAGKRALVLGTGFVALQAAWAARERGLKVTVIELMPRIMPKVLDDQGAKVLHQRILETGVDLHVDWRTEAIERNADGSLTVTVHGEKPFTVDLIIVGTGVRPNIQFVESDALRQPGGIPVDARMQTRVAGIFAAGDVAQGPTTFGEPHEAHALWPTAVEHGKIAGANMAGRTMHYQGSLNMNVTEMFDLSVASMGRYVDSEQTDAHTVYDPDLPRYVKVLQSDGIPIGGVIIGPAEDVPILGALRPLIRQKKQVKDISTLVAQKCYHHPLLVPTVT